MMTVKDNSVLANILFASTMLEPLPGETEDSEMLGAMARFFAPARQALKDAARQLAFIRDEHTLRQRRYTTRGF